MQSRTIIMAIALFATPLSLLAADPPNTGSTETSINGHPLVDAPLSTIQPQGLPPVDRVAQPGSRATASGPVNSTPFSSTPTGTLSGGGVDGSQGDRALASPDADGVTPNVGR